MTSQRLCDITASVHDLTVLTSWTLHPATSFRFQLTQLVDNLRAFAHAVPTAPGSSRFPVSTWWLPHWTPVTSSGRPHLKHQADTLCAVFSTPKDPFNLLHSRRLRSPLRQPADYHLGNMELKEPE